LAHDGDDPINGRRVGGVALPLFREAIPVRNPSVVAGDRRRPAASSNG
jgi:hypothetical protein